MIAIAHPNEMSERTTIVTVRKLYELYEMYAIHTHSRHRQHTETETDKDERNRQWRCRNRHYRLTEPCTKHKHDRYDTQNKTKMKSYGKLKERWGDGEWRDVDWSVLFFVNIFLDESLRPPRTLRSNREAVQSKSRFQSTHDQAAETIRRTRQRFHSVEPIDPKTRKYHAQYPTVCRCDDPP